MLLAVDVGNTNMVFGVYEGNSLLRTFRLMTDVNRTSDEIGLLALSYFRQFQLDSEQVEGIVIASVVPQVMYSLTSAIIKYFGKTPLIVGEDLDPSLPYNIPGNSDERLGADRAVACVSAIAKYGTPLIVLDFGTATTVDAIDEQGRYLGGCITAGVRISTEALFHKAAMLPRIEISMPETVLGTSTVGQIQAGAVMGYVGAMEYLVRRTKQEMTCNGPIQVVATGGLARLISENTDVIDCLDPQLILDGLRLLYDRHTGKQI